MSIMQTQTKEVDASMFRAQFGEDRILAESYSGKTSGYFVEVGANDGVENSNTFYFEQLGWTGLLIEADPDLARVCEDARPGSVIVNCAVVPPNSPAIVTFEISEDIKALSSLSLDENALKNIEHYTGDRKIRRVSVPGKTLDAILEEQDGSQIDFMTIDVEGHEWGVLQGFTLSRWQPKVVLIERNQLLPDKRIMRYMHRNNYVFRLTTGVNDWFYLSLPGSARKASYRMWLLRTFYLPKFLLHYRMILKPLLVNMGVYYALKTLVKGGSSGDRN